MAQMWWRCSGEQILPCVILHFTFRDAIDAAVKYKDNPTDIEDQILEELDNFQMDPKETDKEKEDK